MLRFLRLVGLIGCNTSELARFWAAWVSGFTANRVYGFGLKFEPFRFQGSGSVCTAMLLSRISSKAASTAQKASKCRG